MYSFSALTLLVGSLSTTFSSDPESFLRDLQRPDQCVLTDENRRFVEQYLWANHSPRGLLI